MEYEKINTLWKRDNTRKNVIMPDHFSMEEFKSVKDWLVTEKIDGTNIRVIYNKDGVRFAGRTDKAIIPEQLLSLLEETFTENKMAQVFDLEKSNEIILYGEGYGPKIQKGGGNYRKEQSFILFDIRIDGIWLKWSDVDEYAYKLRIDNVPVFGRGTIDDIIRLLLTQPYSLIEGSDRIVEGFVCRSDPLFLDRFGRRVIWKIKIKDYEQLERMKE
jgi:ATP-dependent RNA circularization protein (DNA/RNA ligase family)